MSGPDAPPDVAQELWLARLARGQPGWLVVRSGSMAPLLGLGDEILVALRPSRFWPGELVVFREAGHLVCHRLMLPWGRHRYVQKGDLNREWETVRREDIVGIPVRVRRGGRTDRLCGARFRLVNTLMWLLVALRDLARQLTRPLPRGANAAERLFSRPIAAIMRSVRQTGGGP